jgi:hypothetical protein
VAIADAVDHGEAVQLKGGAAEGRHALELDERRVVVVLLVMPAGMGHAPHGPTGDADEAISLDLARGSALHRISPDARAGRIDTAALHHPPAPIFITALSASASTLPL